MTKRRVLGTDTLGHCTQLFGTALRDLASSPIIQESVELCKRVNDAAQFHQVIGDLADELVNAINELRTTLDNLTADADEVPIAKRSYSVYTKMAASGNLPSRFIMLPLQMG